MTAGRYLLRVAALALVYVAAARLGVALAPRTVPVATIWPPVGLSLAFLMLFGLRHWPGVTLGAIAATLATGGPVRVALGVGLGATVEVALAARLLKDRRLGWRADMSRVRDVLAYVSVAATTPMAGATVAALAMIVAGRARPEMWKWVWSTWWMGDALGLLLVGPVLLTWKSRPVTGVERWRSPEAFALFAAVAAFAWLCFSGRLPVGVILAPLLTWAALRFGQRGATTTLLAVSMTAAWYAWRGVGPFAVQSAQPDLLQLQLFTAVAGITIMVLAAAATEREQTQTALREARDQLEQKVADRTARLLETMGQLETELAERKRAEEERRRLEAQILQAQKLESLGLLAGGIAHDFNNLLTAMLGHADLALQELPGDSPARRNLEEIERASRRAADLAGQMLAYSGRVQFTMAPLDLSHLVEEMAHLLEASISKKVRLERRLRTGLPPVQADPTQARQIVMNLIINASEAIGDRTGTISIATDLAPGPLDPSDGWVGGGPEEHPYVALEVADDGCGMDADTKARIFDPFFTTKFAGRGLGLATVLGIIRGHGARLRVRSEPQRGTTFTVCFPAADAVRPERPRMETTVEQPAWHGNGLVLVVDDEESVREMAARMVRRLGFETVVAVDGEDAVARFRERASEFVCILLDMTMPRMGGEEALQVIRSIRADVPVILSSGYPEPKALEAAGDVGPTSFIQKPYKTTDLRARFREATGCRSGE